MPLFVLIPLAIASGLLLVLGIVVLPITLTREMWVDLRVAGISFRFRPLKSWVTPPWATPFGRDLVEAFVSEYAEKMPAAFSSIGVQVTSAQLRSHFGQVSATLRTGFLRSAAREKALPDANHDGKPDTYSGLTTSPHVVEVAVTPEMLVKGLVDLTRTALFYELHNTAIWAFAGYDVCLAEGFVGDDAVLATYLKSGDTLKVSAARRRVLDAMYRQI